jgi:hypothetical protein
MIRKLHMIFVAGMIATLAIAGTGCSSGDTVAADDASSTATVAAVPAFSEIQKAVTLDDADAAIVKTALATWQKSAASASTDSPFERHQAGMDFIASVAPSLDNSQLSSLVDFLAAFRDQQMKAVRKTSRERRGNGLDREAKLVASLGLSADQQTAVDALHADMRTQMQALHASIQDGSVTKDQIADKMRALHDTAHTKLATILTPDQLAKFDAAHKDRMNTVLDRRIEHLNDRTETHVTWLATVLGLDASQTSQLKTALQATTAKQKAALEGVREGTLARDASRLQMHETHDAMKQALEGVLTQEQSERLDIIRRLQPRGPRNF